MSLTTDQINKLLGIKESYQASAKLLKILFDKQKREELFRAFLKLETDMTSDWFHVYFEEEHANKLKYAQDFTPDSISKLLAALTGNDTGIRLDVASGTGSLTIQRWHADRCTMTPFEYQPSMFYYQCEELSDRALPFLLFNLMIRGMNATVIHGDSLSREVKQAYFIQNDNDDFMNFSSLNVMPHSKQTEEYLDIRKWLDEPINHIESPLSVLSRLGLKREPEQIALF